MSLELRCGDVMTGCGGVVSGATQDEVLVAAAAHAADVHGLTNIDDATKRQLIAAIHPVRADDRALRAR